MYGAIKETEIEVQPSVFANLFGYTNYQVQNMETDVKVGDRHETLPNGAAGELLGYIREESNSRRFMVLVLEYNRPKVKQWVTITPQMLAQ